MDQHGVSPPSGRPTPEEKERIKLELGFLADEYKALKAEVVQNLASGRQVTGLSLTALGLLLAGAKLIADSGGRLLFLLIPLVFHALAWTQLRYVALAQEMGEYLRDELAARVRALLEEYAGGASEAPVGVIWAAG